MSNPSKQRNNLSNQDRLKIAKLVTEGNVSITPAPHIFGVSYNTTARSIKRKSELEEGIENGTINPKYKWQRRCQFPEIELELVKWISIASAWKYPVTKQVIKDVALSISKKINLNSEKHDDELIGEKNLKDDEQSCEKKLSFIASDGWFNRFKARFGLQSRKLVGEAESSKIETTCRTKID